MPQMIDAHGGGLFFADSMPETDEQQRMVDDEYCQQLYNAWRGKDNPPPAAVPNDTPEKAYGEMREAVQHAWKRGAR